MSSRGWRILFLVFLALFHFLGCAGGSLENLDFEKGLIFFEQWVRITGAPGSPYVFIDFPTYRSNEAEGTLTSFMGIFGKGEGKIDPETANLIVGEGTSLSGVAGSGAASGLEGVGNFPFTTSYQLLQVKEMRADGSLQLERHGDRISFFEFTFPNPLPSRAFTLRPGEKLVYFTAKTFLLGGKREELTLTVTLRSAFVERRNCENGNW